MADPWSGEGDTNYGLGPGVSPTNSNYGIGGQTEPPPTSTAPNPVASYDVEKELMVSIALAGVAGVGALALGLPASVAATFAGLTLAFNAPKPSELISLAIQTGIGAGILEDDDKKMVVDSAGRPTLAPR